MKDSLPEALNVLPINDQSVFVRAAIKAVALEGAIAAVLTSVMILLFLGSWRSTVIIAGSIPLSILGSIIGLATIGETLNLMTLGGLALAVGILVDDLEVVRSQTNELQARRGAIDLTTRQRRSTVQLVRALGGGWSMPVELPSATPS